MADWSTVVLTVGSALGSTAIVLGWYTRFIEARMTNLIAAKSISQEKFTRIEREVESIRQSQVEFAAIAIELDGVKRGQEKLERAIQVQGDAQRSELTGSLNSVREDLNHRFDLIRDLIAANASKSR